MSEALEAPEVHDDTPQSEPADVRARRMGWTDKEEFKGDPAKWVDAETFVKRGEEILPIVQHQNKVLEAALRKAEGEIKDFRKTLTEYKNFADKAEQRSYERALRDLEAQQAEAVAAGDVQAVRDITKEIAGLDKEVRSDTPAHPNGWTTDYADAVDAFKAENSWFETDRSMTAWAKAMDAELAAEGTEAKARLKQLAKLAREEFPHKFKNPARDAPGAVEGGRMGAARGGAKTWADLPADAKSQAERFIKKIPGFTREKFLKDYEW